MRQRGGGGPGGGVPVPEAFHGADPGIAGQVPPGPHGMVLEVWCGDSGVRR
jgi:hypothetical protein